MSDPQTHEPLIAASSQVAINVPAVGGSSTRAYKVAGLTVLACLLIAGQALTVYAVLNQRNDIKSLEQKHKEMKADLRNVRVASVPVKFQLPMSNFPMLTDFLDEGESTAAPEDGTLAEQATKCQLEAAGLKPVAGTSFRPRCDDEQGHYQAQQCWKGRCWCVEPSSGDAIPYSLRNGPAACGGSGDGLSSVGLKRVMALPDAMQVTEE